MVMSQKDDSGPSLSCGSDERIRLSASVRCHHRNAATPCRLPPLPSLLQIARFEHNRWNLGHRPDQASPALAKRCAYATNAAWPSQDSKERSAAYCVP